MAVTKVEKDVRASLMKLKDNGGFKKFNASLIPNIDPDTVIGIRTPDMRAFAKAYAKTPEAEKFLKCLPHKYYEENILHGFIIETMKDYDRAIGELEAWLPYVDNWAVCDVVSPKVFKKNLPDLYKRIKVWIKSKHTYTIRYAIGMLMSHYLDDENFKEEMVRMVCKVKSEEYYVNMMIAWYLATALAKQWDTVIPYIENKKLSKWVQNKTVQKCVESYRITDEQKTYLRTLKIK